MRVALIDKDRMVVQLVQQYLAEAGHTVIELDASVDIILSAGCDLLVLDLNQLAPNGKKLFEEIRAEPKLQFIPCVLIAGRITAGDLQTAKKDATASFLIKPFTKAVFDDGLHRCLRQSLIKNTLTPPAEAKASNTADVIFRWRSDIDQIIQYQQRIRAQLMLQPKDIYEAKLKDWVAKNPDQKPDAKAMKRAIMELVLLKSVVIIDHDQANQNILQEFARNSSILEVESFTDGSEAWGLLQTKAPDFIIMDWSQGDAGGLCLYNRLRGNASNQNTPLVVLNKASDLETLEALFEEDLYLATLEKPLKPKQVQEVLVNLMTRCLSASKVSDALEHAFKQIVSVNLLQDLVHDLNERLPDMKLHLVEMVHKLMKANRFEEAERLARILIEKPDLAVPASTVLARIYHMTRRPEAATDLLRYVCALAPQRLDRLLLAAETEFSMMRLDNARNYLDQARKIDSEDARLEALTYVSEKIEEHGELQSSSVKNLVSVLNTVGVTLAKSGAPSEAIRYYTSALMINSDRLDRARLYYNLGLSYERAQDWEKALAAHIEADRLAAGEIPKLQNHLRHLQDMLNKSA